MEARIKKPMRGLALPPAQKIIAPLAKGQVANILCPYCTTTATTTTTTTAVVH
jgi:hypothetical protein